MASPAKPTVILFFGDDELAIQERLADLEAKLGDATTVAANVTRFNAGHLDLAELESQLYAVPFLGPRRMVLLDLGLLPARASDLPERFFALLEGIPASSVLVALERLDYAEIQKRAGRRKAAGEEAFMRVHAEVSPLFRWIGAHPETAAAREFRSPRGTRFDLWLQARARQLEGEIEPEAATLLRQYTGQDTRLGDTEIRKLLDYVDRARPIRRDDIERLTPMHTESDIFALVDALGNGDGNLAMRRLHHLLAEEDSRYLFGMIVRQFRLLVLARHALDVGRPPSEPLSAAPHRLPAFAAERVGRQALRFSAAQLDAIYHELFALDLATKTGHADLNVGLESLVAALAR